MVRVNRTVRKQAFAAAKHDQEGHQPVLADGGPGFYAGRRSGAVGAFSGARR
jgi:hypothetical protein